MNQFKFFGREGTDQIVNTGLTCIIISSSPFKLTWLLVINNCLFTYAAVIEQNYNLLGTMILTTRKMKFFFFFCLCQLQREIPGSVALKYSTKFITLIIDMLFLLALFIPHFVSLEVEFLVWAEKRNKYCETKKRRRKEDE